MSFDPNIQYNENVSFEDNMKAMMNFLNFVVREMTVGRVKTAQEDILKTENTTTALLDADETKKTQAALELRKALQLFIATLDADTQAEMIMEVPSVFPKYVVGKAYKIKEVFSYGTNGVGDAQLYQVLQDHTSAEQWTPDATPSLYKAIGVTEDGYPEWVQPLGASDAYNTGDIVSYNGTLYKSTIDGNVWSPEAYPQGWVVVE